MTETQSKIDTIRDDLEARIRDLQIVRQVAVSFALDALVVNVGAQYELDVRLTLANWRCGFSSGVQVTVRAPYSKRVRYGHGDQARTFRTGKDGSTLNVDGILKVVAELAQDMHDADESRAAEQKTELAQRDRRDEDTLALVAAGHLPARDKDFDTPVHYGKVELRDGVEADLDSGHHGVSIKLQGLTAEQAVTILGRLR